MAAYDLEEQEQLSELKAWWQQYGTLVTTVAALVAVAVVAYQGWNWYQRKQAAEAAAVYAILQKAATERNAKNTAAAAGELIDKYGRTTYAALGALVSARVQFDAGDLGTAKSQLAWAADNARDEELRDLARLRLANVLMDEKAYDDALKRLEKEPLAAYAARYAELRGDVHAIQDRRAEARSAYQSALTKLGAEQGGGRGANLRELLQLKLDALGDGQ